MVILAGLCRRANKKPLSGVYINSGKDNLLPLPKSKVSKTTHLPPEAGWIVLYQGLVSISVADWAFSRRFSKASLVTLVKELS